MRMIPIIKIVIVVVLVVVICSAIIVPTVVVSMQKQTSPNVSSTKTTTPLPETIPILTSNQTNRPISTSTSNNTEGTTSRPSTITNASISTTTRLMTTTTTNTSLFSATYSSALTRASERFDSGLDPTKPWFYYEAFFLNTMLTGPYRIFSRSNIDTYGYLYDEMFHPRFPMFFRIGEDDERGGSNQFLIEKQLEVSRTYIVIVTTYEMNVTGAFSIVVTGPGPINLTHFNVPVFLSRLIQTNTSSSLTNSSAKLCHSSPCTSPSHNYQALAINVNSTARLEFHTQSDMDTFGYLYNNTFNPANVAQNLIASDDDSANQGQFLLSATLRVGIRYIVVVTTYTANVVGPFVLIVRGAGNYTVAPISP